ncbi:MAG: NRDE family protein [bacterium]|nr:NRDE family protein [bacterium]
MCTVTVLRGDDGVILTVNRDELRGRALEIEPSAGRRSPNHPLRVAPMDGHRCGTWVGANEDGVIGCLLNRYHANDMALVGRPETPSRGWIVDELLSFEASRIREWLCTSFDPSPFPSFALVVATPDEGSILTWEHGGDLERRTLPLGWTMETSAFWQADQIQEWRQAAFQRWLSEECEMDCGVPAFNLLHDEDHPECSPLMTRERSMTRSVTQVQVSLQDRSVVLRYWPRHEGYRIEANCPRTHLSVPLLAREG